MIDYYPCQLARFFFIFYFLFILKRKHTERISVKFIEVEH